MTEIVLTVLFDQFEGGATPTAEQLARPQLQQMQLSLKAVLSSCFCRIDYYALPAYDDSANSSGDGESTSARSAIGDAEKRPLMLPKGAYGFSQCMCKELGEREQQEYGVSKEEVAARYKAEEAGRVWLESIRTKSDPDNLD
jgi:hypothetical protein